MATTTEQRPPQTQRTKCTYTGEIVAPDDGTEVPFGEDVIVRGSATKSCDDGTREDVTGDIEWREYGSGQFRAHGPSVTLNFKSRKNSRVALYVHSEDLAHIDLKVVCNAVDPKRPPTNDQLALALMILTEGRTCSQAEQEAIGACALNRLRVYPDRFGSTLRGVLEQPSQFKGTKFKLYRDNVDNPANIRKTFVYEDCMEMKKVLPIAISLLARGGPITPGGFSGLPFYFNRSSQAFGPAGKHSPRVHAKDGGFKHSFYGYDGRG